MIRLRLNDPLAWCIVSVLRSLPPSLSVILGSILTGTLTVVLLVMSLTSLPSPPSRLIILLITLRSGSLRGLRHIGFIVPLMSRVVVGSLLLLVLSLLVAAVVGMFTILPWLTRKEAYTETNTIHKSLEYEVVPSLES